MPVKKVLVCPMDWGLGHATRDAGLIAELIRHGFEVIIGADKAPLLFLRQYFPQLPFIVMPSYNICYPIKGNMALKMLLSMPKILFGIVQEHRFLYKILKSDKFDIIISDNRYGLWNKSVYSIFITHQLHILAPEWIKWAEKILFHINRWFIKKYNECWVPDFASGESISGTLSHINKLPENICFIGILSRFKQIAEAKLPHELRQDYEIMAIISGPEPQRSIFEKILLTQMFGTKHKCLIVLGKPLNGMFAQSGNITIVSHIKSEHLRQLIIKTPVIISRSGYSTIMDLFTLLKSAILIPTPGQTEQEYLAQRMMDKKWFYCIKQGDFELISAIVEFKSFSFQQFPQIESTLSEALTKLL